MGDTVSDLTGGILGGGGKSKVVQVPIREREADKPTAAPSVDPNRSDAVAEARRRRLALGRRTGRSALRIDLNSGGTQTRSGISIG